MLVHRPCDPAQIVKADKAMAFMMQWIQELVGNRRLWEAYESIFK